MTALAGVIIGLGTIATLTVGGMFVAIASADVICPPDIDDYYE